MKKLANVFLILAIAISSLMIAGCAKLEDLVITGVPTEIFVGQSIDLTDLQITAIMSNEDQITISLQDEDLTITNISTEDVGVKTFKVKYKEIEKTFSVTVKEVIVTNLTLTGYQASCFKGDTYDTTGITGVATMSDGSTKNVQNTELTFGTINTNVPGTVDLEVTYQGFTTEISVAINPIVVANLEISGQPEFVFINDTLVTTGITATAIMNNSSTKPVTNAELTFGTINTQTLGDKELTITYEDFTTTVTIEVVNVTELVVSGHNTVIDVGDTYVTTGITAIATLSNGEYYNVSNEELSFNTLDTSLAGEVDLEVTFKNFTKTIEVTIEPITVVGLTVLNYPLTVYINENYETSGITATASLSNEGTYNCSNIELTFNTIDTSSIGVKTLQVTYKEFTKDIEITVVSVTELEVIGYNSNCFVGDNYVVTGITARATLSNNDIVDVLNTELTFNTLDTSKVGTAKLEVTFKNFTKEIDINVNRVTVTDLVVSGYDASCFVGDVYDTTHIVAVAYLSNNTTKNVTNEELDFNELDTANAGTAKLEVTYDGFTKEIDITVNAILVTDLEVYGYAESCFVGDDYDTSNITAKAYLSNNKTKDLLNSDLTFNELDTTEAGTAKLEVTYDGFTKEINITVKVNPIEVVGFSKPINLVQYETNRLNTENYMLSNQMYEVGDDNALILKPVVDAFDNELDDFVDVEEVNTVIKLYEFKNNNYVLIEDLENSEYIDKIIFKNINVDFSSLAINKQFKMEVFAKNTELNAITFEFIVVDAYNVYDADDLSVIDNLNYDNRWTKIKTDAQLMNVTTNGVVLHTKLDLYDSNIPSYYFWNEDEVKENGLNTSIVGSMKDVYDFFIFERRLKDNETFTINGNYFQIDASRIALAKYNKDDGYVVEGEKGNAITMHTALFKFRSVDNAVLHNGNVNVKNIAFKGNTIRNADAKYSGGLLLSKAQFVNYNAFNTSFQQWFLGYMFEQNVNYATVDGRSFVLSDYCDNYYTLVKDDVTYYLNKINNAIYTDSDLTNVIYEASQVNAVIQKHTLDYTIGAQCYSSLLYIWGSRVDILNSTLTACGGPVMIVDHIRVQEKDKDTALGGTPSYVNCVDSDLQSWVTGLEPWFATYGATEQVASLAQADVYFSDANYSAAVNGTASTTILDTTGVPKMNIVAVYKSGNAEGLTAYKNRGYVAITTTDENGDLRDTKPMNMSGPLASAVYGTTQSALIENNFTGQYVGGGAGFDMLNPNSKTYINVYLPNGMAAVIQLMAKA